MIINIKNKEVELKFTFNSFRYMENFDLRAINEVESKPFRIIPIIEVLLLGAVNNDPKVKFSIADVQSFVMHFVEVEEGSVAELLQDLMELLQSSSFFKSLQKTTKK